MDSFCRAVTVGIAATATCFASIAVGAPPALAAPGDAIQTIASGFAGALHLSVAPNGRIYVADAFLGQISRVDPSTGSVTTIASDLGFSPGIDVQGGQIWFTSSSEPETGQEEGPTQLMRMTPSGVISHVADLSAFELAQNPDGQPHVDDASSNPYAVLALPGRTIVADAAGNDLVEVRANGDVRTLTVFPVSRAGDCATETNNGVANGGCDPVPTDIALGPDGYLYVSGLGAFAEGFVWKVDATTGRIVSTRGGLPPLTGIAVGNDGSVYAASPFAGLIFRFAPGGGVTVAELADVADVEWADGVLYATTAPENGPGTLVTVGASAFQ